jgi:MFS family permease
MKEAKEPITAYHWIVVIIASLGWLFDCMDQRLFALSRESAIASLLGPDATPEAIKSGLMTATTWMILGWATGGIIFGILSDRWGRVKTMAATLLLYSIFTGLSGFSQGIFDFMVYRFLVGLGVGGMFGAATTLVAESVPSRLRAPALGALQALATVGNMMGSGISLFVPPGSPDGLFGYEGWRSLFFFGIIPAVLVVPMVLLLKEPTAWLNFRNEKKKSEKNAKSGSMTEMFGHPTWRKNAIIGLLLGVSGMIGLWGIGFFSPELISEALKGEKQEVIDQVRGRGTILFDIGAFLGMSAFTFVAALVSRRMAFLVFLILSMAATIFVFNNLNSASDAYWMLPMMGFAQLSLFAGYSIYFPELFPTRLRGTGVGFCYNTVRYLAAPAPILLAYLSTTLSFREGASLMACVYILGIVALIWAPETKDKELPE